jgi:hypothetical protein
MSQHTVETLYLVSGFFTSLAGFTMILVYSLTNPWWRTLVGRMLITYAVAETGMSLIFALAIGFQINPLIFRYLWVGLQASVGCMLWLQTSMIIVLAVRRRRRRRQS